MMNTVTKLQVLALASSGVQVNGVFWKKAKVANTQDIVQTVCQLDAANPKKDDCHKNVGPREIMKFGDDKFGDDAVVDYWLPQVDWLDNDDNLYIFWKDDFEMVSSKDITTPTPKPLCAEPAYEDESVCRDQWDTYDDREQIKHVRQELIDGIPNRLKKNPVEFQQKIDIVWQDDHKEVTRTCWKSNSHFVGGLFGWKTYNLCQTAKTLWHKNKINQVIEQEQKDRDFDLAKEDDKLYAQEQEAEAEAEAQLLKQRDQQRAMMPRTPQLTQKQKHFAWIKKMNAVHPFTPQTESSSPEVVDEFAGMSAAARKEAAHWDGGGNFGTGNRTGY